MYTIEDIATALANEPEHDDKIGRPNTWGSGKQRSIETTWRLGPGVEWPTSENKGKEGIIELTLTTHHHGKSDYCGPREKYYGSTLRVGFVTENTATREDGTEYTYRVHQTRVSYGTEGEAVGILNADVERFSAKSMREHHAEALRSIVEAPRHVASFIVGGVEAYTAREVAA